jgi:hypothetical protein
MKTKTAFGGRMQTVVIISMITSFLLIIQKANSTLHKVGLMLLIASAISQMAFGNISSEATFKESKKVIIVAYLIVACVFGLGIILAPILIKIGR